MPCCWTQSSCSALRLRAHARRPAGEAARGSGRSRPSSSASPAATGLVALEAHARDVSELTGVEGSRSSAWTPAAGSRRPRATATCRTCGGPASSRWTSRRGARAHCDQRVQRRPRDAQARLRWKRRNPGPHRGERLDLRPARVRASAVLRATSGSRTGRSRSRGSVAFGWRHPPRVTVVILAYRRLERLRETLTHTLEDLDYPAERSSDRRRQRLGERHPGDGRARSSPSVKVIVQPKNVGTSGWNAGLLGGHGQVDADARRRRPSGRRRPHARGGGGRGAPGRPRLVPLAQRL